MAPKREGERLTPPIRLLVCDDHRVMNHALEVVLAGYGREFELLAEPLTDPEEAVRVAEDLAPDVVLMDVEFPTGAIDGIEATRRIKERCPDTNVVVMTAYEANDVLLRAVEAGASGFLPKTEAFDRLLDTVRGAARGEVLVDPGTLGRLLFEAARERATRAEAARTFGHLTAREREILQLLAQGSRNDDIAQSLYISPQTVQTHVRNVLGKLRVRSRLEAVTLAARHGMVEV